MEVVKNTVHIFLLPLPLLAQVSCTHLTTIGLLTELDNTEPTQKTQTRVFLLPATFAPCQFGSSRFSLGTPSLLGGMVTCVSLPCRIGTRTQTLPLVFPPQLKDNLCVHTHVHVWPW